MAPCLGLRLGGELFLRLFLTDARVALAADDQAGRAEDHPEADGGDGHDGAARRLASEGDGGQRAQRDEGGDQEVLHVLGGGRRSKDG